MFNENDSRQVAAAIAGQSQPIMRGWEDQIARTVSRVRAVTEALRDKADAAFGATPRAREGLDKAAVSGGGVCNDISVQIDVLRQATGDLESEAARFFGLV